MTEFVICCRLKLLRLLCRTPCVRVFYGAAKTFISCVEADLNQVIGLLQEKFKLEATCKQ